VILGDLPNGSAFSALELDSLWPPSCSDIDAVIAQRLRIGLAPALQVLFARIQSLAILAPHVDDQVHVRVFGRFRVWIFATRGSA